MIPICKHCGEGKVNRPRGLCWNCFYRPGVRDMYPSTSKYARKGVGVDTCKAAMPPVPTMAAPGTPEKVSVMEERARLKLSLWHPMDARIFGEDQSTVIAATVRMVG